MVTTAGTTTPPAGIYAAPPPWKCKCTIYSIHFWTPKSVSTTGLPAKAYSPLEAGSAFADPKQAGVPLGGLSSIQIIRYSDTPAGSYDEMLLVPGNFAYPAPDKEGRVGKGKPTKKGLKCTRIYVSQKQTCWNGRHNWNIPKHLARFDWTTNPDFSETVRVYPHDVTDPYDPNEFPPTNLTTKPFFAATFHPTKFAPYFPMSTSWYKFLGLDIHLVQPPLPEGKGSEGELPGTEKWCKIFPQQWSKRACVGWYDMKQEGETREGEENWWPGMGRWAFGAKMEDAEIVFGEGEYWDVPRAVL